MNECSSKNMQETHHITSNMQDPRSHFQYHFNTSSRFRREL